MNKPFITALLVFSCAGGAAADRGKPTNAGTPQAQFDRLYKSSPVDAGFALARFAAETCDLPLQTPDLERLVGLMGIGLNGDEITIAAKTLVLAGYPAPGDHDGMCEKTRASLRIIEGAAQQCRETIKHSSNYGSTCF